MNYFTVTGCLDIGNGFLLLTLTHDYGTGPDVRLPIAGDGGDFQIGSRIEVTISVVKG